LNSSLLEPKPGYADSWGARTPHSKALRRCVMSVGWNIRGLF